MSVEFGIFKKQMLTILADGIRNLAVISNKKNHFKI